ncbi:unnamed protein product (mitochondrion) [Plasmodiophora brassicae]|uniref:Uncharacterized protein n=1 Tax=Plasmodiophora brassicae TaxID=37360 RepID=A0A3P3YMS6_PLABS|nr:unnamed protein product [Plasmodiophora brassicae]
MADTTRPLFVVSAIVKSEASSEEQTTVVTTAQPPKQTEMSSSLTMKKPSGKIADLQARLNLNPAMLSGPLTAPNAMALIKSKRRLAIVSDASPEEAPDENQAEATCATTGAESMPHLDRPVVRPAGRRSRTLPA